MRCNTKRIVKGSIITRLRNVEMYKSQHTLSHIWLQFQYVTITDRGLLPS